MGSVTQELELEAVLDFAVDTSWEAYIYPSELSVFNTAEEEDDALTRYNALITRFNSVDSALNGITPSDALSRNTTQRRSSTPLG
mgnify:CR=1 FL=1